MRERRKERRRKKAHTRARARVLVVDELRVRKTRGGGLPASQRIPQAPSRAKRKARAHLRSIWTPWFVQSCDNAVPTPFKSCLFEKALAIRQSPFGTFVISLLAKSLTLKIKERARAKGCSRRLKKCGKEELGVHVRRASECLPPTSTLDKTLHSFFRAVG